MFNKANFKEWFDRYKYSELAATGAALLASQFSRIFSGLTTAYLITFAEYFAFYGVMIFRSYKALSVEKKQKNQSVTLKEIIDIVPIFEKELSKLIEKLEKKIGNEK